MIAWLPHSTNPVYAGTRTRCLTPLRLLRRRGVNAEIFDERNARSYRAVVIQGLRCRDSAEDAATGDAVLALAERLKGRGCRIVVEDCDNHFYNPRQLREWDETAQRLRKLILLADHLVASTDAVAALFRRETGTTLPITIIGDGVERERELNFEPHWRRWLSWRRKIDWFRYLRLRAAIERDKRKGIRPLVWFGSHGSAYADGGMRDIENIRRPLETLGARFELSLTVISNSRSHFEELVRPMALRTRYLEWNRTSFLAALALHDIAVIPVTRTPFTVCKSNNRLLLPLSLGLAVCADSIPSYAEFSHVCELDNWEQGLEGYITSKSRRWQHATAAKSMIERGWTPEAIARKWEHLVEAVCA